MVMPDEIDFYKNCSTLVQKVERLRSALRHPTDVQIMDEVLFQLKALDLIDSLKTDPPKA
jgi:hypothetical protein